jgi:hypothetical protein
MENPDSLNAEEAYDRIESYVEAFKLARMLIARCAIISPSIEEEMFHDNPGIDGPPKIRRAPDCNGAIVFPWQDGYDEEDAEIIPL